MSQSHAELPNLHCHFDQWIDASAQNRLSKEQQNTLDRHLTECTWCMRRSESEKDLLALEAQLENDGIFGEAFETCQIVGFEQDVQFAASKPTLTIPVRLRILIALAASLIVMIHIVDPNLGNWVTQHPIVAAAQQIILDNPDYTEITQSAIIAAEDHLPLAALHKLTTMLAETLAWLVLLFGLRRLILIAIQRRLHTNCDADFDEAILDISTANEST